MKWRGVLRKYPLPSCKQMDMIKLDPDGVGKTTIYHSPFPRVPPAAIQRFDPIRGLESEAHRFG